MVPMISTTTTKSKRYEHKKKNKDGRVKDRSKVFNNMKKVRIEAAQNTAQNTAQNNLTEGNF